MRKQNHTLMKVIVASMLLSIVCSVTLNFLGSGCTAATQMKVFARTSTGTGAGTAVCVALTDYTPVGGCKYYLVDVASNPAGLSSGSATSTTTTFTCDGGVMLEAKPTAGCTTGYTEVNAKKASETSVAVCVKSTNTVASPEIAKGCQYYVAAQASANLAASTTETTDTFVCANTLLKTGATACESGYTSIKVVQASGDTAVKDACVSTTNPTYVTQLAKGCASYQISTTGASVTFPLATTSLTCQGVSLSSVPAAGCASGSTKIAVKLASGDANVFGCVKNANPVYTTDSAKGCGSFLVATGTVLTQYPILTATLTCTGVSLTAPGSGCASGSTFVNVRTSATGTNTGGCLSNTNPLYSATTCSYYLVASNTNLATYPIVSDTFTCSGMLLTATTCGSGKVQVQVKTSLTGAATAVCADNSNPLYTATKGCGFYLISSTVNTASLPAVTDVFTCVGIEITPSSSACTSTTGTGAMKISKTVLTDVSTAQAACTQTDNALYTSESPKLCGYYLVDSGVTITVGTALQSITFVCKGVSLKPATSGCDAGSISIPVKKAVGDATSTNMCVSKTNPLYLEAGPSCQFYLTDGVATDLTVAIGSTTLTCSGVAGLTAPDASGACPAGKVLIQIKDSSSPTAVPACYNETDPLYSVQNCESYLVTVVAGTGTFPTLPFDTTTLTCTCSSTTTTQSTKNLAGLSRKACIPNTQWRVNCDTYRKISVGQYSCSACQTGASFIVQLGKDTANGNSKNYTDACTPAKIPGCQTYKIFSTTATPFDGIGTAYDNIIGCVTCSGGFTSYSATSTNKFFFWSTTTDTVGQACPADGSITSCTQVKLVNGAYVCNTCSDTTYGVMTNYYDASSKLTVGCLLKGTSTPTYYLNIDPNCDLFSWGNADLHTGFTCMRCKSGYVLKKVYDDTTSTNYTRCVPSSTFITANCQDLIVADLSATTLTYKCYSCAIGFTKLNTALVGSTKYQGICVKTGRFETISACTTYDANMNFDNIFGLKCGACSGGIAPPCQASCTPGVTGGTVTKGFSAQNNQATPGQICVTSNYVDNCDKYSMTSAPATGGQSGANDCIKCKTGFTNVTTSATKTAGGNGMICIKPEQVIANCNIYNNADLSCSDCKNKLGFDKTNWKCRAPTDVSASCTKGVMVGDKLVCITCPIGYTLKDGACVTAVPFCASLSSAGVCSACVQPNNYQLINNKCILKPVNCATVNENGACTACKPGFLLTVDKSCAVTSSNTCPAGQFLSNGVCVTGTIANCQTYDKNGKCDTCKSGFTLSTNGKECTVSSSGSSNRYPNAPPCPPDTNKFRYVRNPSDPNGPCVPVDVQCANPRDDGHCISCKDGEFAHTDGLCYKIVFPSN